ncbi:hypothetical protein NW754_015523 [Fusarium falciforme]|nr:hypothetical protein NW754_015523 [Fusarium falciforme]
MAFTSTHPTNAWRPSTMYVHEFQAAMAEACRNYYGDSSRDKLYNKVRVLAVHWEVVQNNYYTGVEFKAERV